MSGDRLTNRSIVRSFTESVKMKVGCDIYHIELRSTVECLMVYFNHTSGLDLLVSDKSRRLSPVDCDG